MKNLRGKFLVRRTTLKDGTKAVILCGTFIPGFDPDEISDGDEMWVADIEIKPLGWKFTNPHKISFSPEDFLMGINQMPSDWQNKSILE